MYRTVCIKPRVLSLWVTFYKFMLNLRLRYQSLYLYVVTYGIKFCIYIYLRGFFLDFIFGDVTRIGLLLLIFRSLRLKYAPNTIGKAEVRKTPTSTSINETYNELSGLLTNKHLLNDDITLLNSATAALHDQFQECLRLEKELRAIVLDDIQDEYELDVFFANVTEVTSANRGKFNKIHFFLK